MIQAFSLVSTAKLTQHNNPLQNISLRHNIIATAYLYMLNLKADKYLRCEQRLL